MPRSKDLQHFLPYGTIILCAIFAAIKYFCELCNDKPMGEYPYNYRRNNTINNPATMRTKGIKLAVMLLAVLAAGGCAHQTETPYSGKMQFRDLGNTGIRVAEIGIGCEVFEELDTAQSRAYMDVALDSGINYIDIYDANPTVRSNIGYALRGRREKMNIQGHIGCYWNHELNQYERTRDVSKAKQGFDDLLQRLATDHVEVGMMHIFDDMADWDSIPGSAYMKYVQQLKSEGKIKHIGMSSHNPAVALAAAKSGLVEVIMFSINPAFDRVVSGADAWNPESYKNMLPGIDPVRQELYDYCAQNGIAIVVMKVFGGGGRLLDAERSPLGFALTTTQCLAYALAKPCVSVALCGTSNVEQLVEDLRYVNATEQEKAYNTALQNIGSALADKAATSQATTFTTTTESTPTASQSCARQADCGNCTYCGHCSPCPVGINIARVNQLLDKAKGHKTVPSDVAAEYKALELHASECIGCGACERRCPFDVPVRQKMQEAAQTFGY